MTEDKKGIEYVVLKTSAPILRGGKVSIDGASRQADGVYASHCEALESADLINRNSYDWSPGHKTTAEVIAREKK